MLISQVWNGGIGIFGGIAGGAFGIFVYICLKGISMVCWLDIFVLVLLLG